MKTEVDDFFNGVSILKNSIKGIIEVEKSNKKQRLKDLKKINISTVPLNENISTEINTKCDFDIIYDIGLSRSRSKTLKEVNSKNKDRNTVLERVLEFLKNQGSWSDDLLERTSANLMSIYEEIGRKIYECKTKLENLENKVSLKFNDLFKSQMKNQDDCIKRLKLFFEVFVDTQNLIFNSPFQHLNETRKFQFYMINYSMNLKKIEPVKDIKGEVLSRNLFYATYIFTEESKMYNLWKSEYKADKKEEIDYDLKSFVNKGYENKYLESAEYDAVKSIAAKITFYDGFDKLRTIFNTLNKRMLEFISSFQNNFKPTKILLETFMEFFFNIQSGGTLKTSDWRPHVIYFHMLEVLNIIEKSPYDINIFELNMFLIIQSILQTNHPLNYKKTCILKLFEECCYEHTKIHTNDCFVYPIEFEYVRIIVEK